MYSVNVSLIRFVFVSKSFQNKLNLENTEQYILLLKLGHSYEHIKGPENSCSGETC